jgi:hypothetical protein
MDYKGAGDKASAIWQVFKAGTLVRELTSSRKAWGLLPDPCPQLAIDGPIPAAHTAYSRGRQRKEKEKAGKSQNHKENKEGGE